MTLPLTDHTEPVMLGGDRTFLLDRPTALYVKSGRIDVFLVAMHEGKPVGQRWHLFRIRAEELLLPFHGHASDAEWGLVGVGTGETTVHQVPLDRIRTWSQEAGLATSIAPHLEAWVRTLSDALSSRITKTDPGAYTSLTIEEETDVPPATIVRPDDGFVWIQGDDDQLHFMGTDTGTPTYKEGDGDGIRAAPNQPFPLASSAWLRTRKVCKLTAITTDNAIANGSVWAGMQVFQSAFFHAAVRTVNAERAVEHQRLTARAEDRRSAMTDAYSELANVLGDAPKKHVSTQADDPHLAAAQIVADAFDHSLTASPSHDPQAYQRDPLNCIARASGLQTRKVALRGSWWKQDNGPLYARMEDGGRPVALLSESVGTYVMHDPTRGTRTVVDESVAADLHPFGYTFYRPFPDHPLSARDLLAFGSRPIRSDLITVVGMAAAGGLLSMATPIVTGMIFEDVIPGAERDQLLTLTLALIVCAIVAACFRFTQNLALLRAQGKVASVVQSAVWDRLVNLPLSFFRSYTAGDLAQRAMGFSAAQRTLSGPVITSILGGVFSIFNFGLLYYYSPKLALWATLMAGIALLITAAGNYLQIKYQRKIVQMGNEVSSLVLQLLTGLSKLRIAGVEAKAFSLWAKKFSTKRRVQYKTRRIDNALLVLNRVLPLVTSLVIFALSVPLVFEEASLSTGHLLAFLAALTAFLMAMTSMSSAVTQTSRIIPIYENARPILTTRPEVDVSKAKPGKLDGTIEMQHVSFRYDASTPLVLDDLSLRIEAGEFIALVGPSGSGKSTIFKVLVGFEQPEAGSIYYDDQELSGLDVKAVRRQIGVVLQSGKLMPGDIYENIAGASMISRDEAWRAARVAELADAIEAMPMGMHTVVSEGGGTLSGGQVQRLMIARAVVNNPRILFFDEATSALDNKTQKQISRSLDRLKATRIVIAHRLSTIRNADRIVVVDRGQVAEEGTYEHLMKKDGVFARLAERQLA